MPGIANTSNGHYSPGGRAAEIAVAVAVALVCACGAGIPDYDYSAEPDPRKTEYTLGVGDEISVNVWQNPALSTNATVRPDGTITLPLVGDLRAAGRTPSDLKAEIKTRMAKFVKLEGTEVTLAVVAVNSYRFTVSGEVVRPGVFNPTYYVTVADAIAQAGGLTRFAKGDDMVIMRVDPKAGTVRRIPVPYSLIASGEHPQLNLVLLPGDTLHVP
jgi:polysaccharide export outer membrane protein